MAKNETLKLVGRGSESYPVTDGGTSGLVVHLPAHKFFLFVK